MNERLLALEETAEPSHYAKWRERTLNERLLALEETAEPSLYAKWKKKGLIEILYGRAGFRTCFVPRCKESCRHCEVCVSNDDAYMSRCQDILREFEYDVPCPERTEPEVCKEGCESVVCKKCQNWVNKWVREGCI